MRLLASLHLAIITYQNTLQANNNLSYVKAFRMIAGRMIHLHIPVVW